MSSAGSVPGDPHGPEGNSSSSSSSKEQTLLVLNHILVHLDLDPNRGLHPGPPQRTRAEGEGCGFTAMVTILNPDVHENNPLASVPNTG